MDLCTTSGADKFVDMLGKELMLRMPLQVPGQLSFV